MNFLDDFRTSVLAGLSQEQKAIPCRFFYDQQGSQLFSQITSLEEYYPTRTEKEILFTQAASLRAALPSGLSVVELGSGTSEKTPLLLSALERVAAYVPVDIDSDTLRDAAKMIEARFPSIPVVPVHADFTKPFTLPASVQSPKLGFFPGSTIGNFTDREAEAFLSELATSLGTGSYLLVGADRVKDRAILERAYNDSAGVTAAFNLNVLARINRELGGTFDLDAFEHKAVWNPDVSAVQMFIESQQDQEVHVAGRTFKLSAGEAIHTEDSHKYTPEAFRKLAARAGWKSHSEWTDQNDLFGIYLFERVTYS